MIKTKVIIYFDYELQQGADRSTNKVCWNGFEEYDNVEKLLDLLKKYDVKVCFATLGTIATGNKLPYSSKKQIKKIYDQGHEIGSHSQKHHSMTSMNSTDLLKDLKESKKLLEDTINEKVITFVPPRNLPFNFFGIAVGLRKKNIKNKVNKRIPFIPLRSLGTFRKIVSDAGYKIYREYDLFPKRKNKKTKKLLINKLDLTGFGQKSREHILKNKNKKEIITCYAHPHALSYKGKQSFQELEKLIKMLKEQNIKTTLPKEMLHV